MKQKFPHPMYLLLFTCFRQDMRGEVPRLMNAIPEREQQEVAAEMAGVWKQENRENALNLAVFKAKYQKRYPEAVHSLCEDEEHLQTFYALPPAMHRYIRSANAIEGNLATHAGSPGILMKILLNCFLVNFNGSFIAIAETLSYTERIQDHGELIEGVCAMAEKTLLPDPTC